MIRGEFDPRNYNRPTVTGVVRVDQLGVERVVDFLLDTGADATCLHYPDVAVADYSNGTRASAVPCATASSAAGSLRHSLW